MPGAGAGSVAPLRPACRRVVAEPEVGAGSELRYTPAGRWPTTGRQMALAAAAVMVALQVVQVQSEGFVPLGMQPAKEERLLARAALHDHFERRGQRSSRA